MFCKLVLQSCQRCDCSTAIMVPAPWSPYGCTMQQVLLQKESFDQGNNCTVEIGGNCSSVPCQFLSLGSSAENVFVLAASSAICSRCSTRASRSPKAQQQLPHPQRSPVAAGGHYLACRHSPQHLQERRTWHLLLPDFCYLAGCSLIRHCNATLIKQPVSVS